MNSLFQDIRYAVRTLLRQPLFTAVAVLVLGLGIGANTAVFSVVDAVLLRPLPFPHPEQLVSLRENLPQFPFASVSFPDYLDWRASQHSFTDLAALRASHGNVSFSPASGLPPERLNAAEVSANFLTVLGVPPQIGRNFTEAEDTAGGPKAVVLGDALWRRRFAADPKVIGQTLMMDGVAREIVGVAAPAVVFPRRADLFVPFGDERKERDLNSRDSHPGLGVLGRLKPGVTLAQAHDEMERIATELDRRYPESNTGVRVGDQTLLNYQVGDYRKSLWLLLSAVGCVLLIACANVANLQLARAAGRTKELAVRAALGAGRRRLLRLMLAESMVLGLLGGAVALLFALWAMDAISALSPANVSRFHELRLNLPALAFTTLVAMGTGLLVGAWPAWRMSRLAAMATALHESGARGSTGGIVQQRARGLLVIAQLVLTVVLLAAAGITIKSFWRAENAPLGFDTRNLLMISLSLPEKAYPPEKMAAFSARLLERVRLLPQVKAAAIGSDVPFSGSDWESDVHVTGTPPNQPGREPQAMIGYVTPEYLKTMGIPLLRGRDFDSREVRGQPRTVVIDELFAKRFFPGKDAVGEHIDDSQTNDKNAAPVTVVGVSGHTQHDAPSNAILQDMPKMYYCTAQMENPNFELLIRVNSGDPMRVAEPVRREVLALDPDLPIANINTVAANVSDAFAPERLTAVLLVTFAALALVLAGTGLYGVVALSVTQRTRELGIRLALGAQRSSVVGLVLGQSARLIGIGLGLGLVAALAAGRLLAHIVLGADALDVTVLLSVAAVLAVVGLLASYLPALRATGIDPLVALREE